MSDLKRSLFCPHCIKVDLLDGDISCGIEGCACNKSVGLRNILDLFGLLYYHLNGVNLVYYETIARTNSERCLIDHCLVESIWLSHLEGKIRYTTSLNWDLTQDTIRIVHILLKTKNKEDLLIRIMGILKTLDKHLDSLRDFLAMTLTTNGVISTHHGEVVIKRESPLHVFLSSDSEYAPKVDPNYLLLRNYTKSFHLAKTHYPYYRVSHQTERSNQFDSVPVGDIKFGFIPGKTNVEQDYRFRIFAKDQRNRLPFVFNGLSDETTYIAHSMELFRNVLNNNPHFVVFPEFYTPLSLQENFKKELSSRANGRVWTPFLTMSGSFHVKGVDIDTESVSNGVVYNYAQVINGLGDKTLGVYKMNQFVFARDQKNGGALKPFRKWDGVELNAFDKREVTLLETPLGRIAIFICVDFLNVNLEEVIIDRHVDVLFVMTMTPNPSGGKFLRRAQEIGERNGTIVILCNNLGSSNSSFEPSKEARVVVVLPGVGQYISSKEWDVITFEEMLAVVKAQKCVKETSKKYLNRKVRAYKVPKSIR